MNEQELNQEWENYEATAEVREEIRTLFDTGKFPWGVSVPHDWRFLGLKINKKEREYEFAAVGKRELHVEVKLMCSDDDKDEYWIYVKLNKALGTVTMGDIAYVKKTFIGSRQATVLLYEDIHDLTSWQIIAQF